MSECILISTFIKLIPLYILYTLFRYVSYLIFFFFFLNIIVRRYLRISYSDIRQLIGCSSLSNIT